MLGRLYRLPFRLLQKICLALPYFRFIHETADTQTPISFDQWFEQEVKGVNKGPYWPVHPASVVTGWRNIEIGVETSPGLMAGCYIQGIGKIKVGDYTQISANVGMVSANHALTDSRQHEPQDIVIGDYCWIGFGAVILPGVELGDFTVVGAGAIVTRSFPEGHCVIAGNPAKKIKDIPVEECVRFKSRHEYHGYIPASEFETFKRRELNV